MADQQQGAAAGEEFLDAPQAAVGESFVANRQNLVHHEHVGVGVDGDGKAEAHVHARGVVLHRFVDEIGQAGKLDDRVVTIVDLAAREAEHRAVDVDIFAARDLRMETRAQLDQRRHAAVDFEVARSWFEDTGDDFEQGRLARTIRADQANRFAMTDPEGDVLHRRDTFVRAQAKGQDCPGAARFSGCASGGRRRSADTASTKSFDPDGVALPLVRRAAHTASTRVSLRRSKRAAPSHHTRRLEKPIASHNSGAGTLP